ncbi:MAG: DJ-1/PfpI family protein [Treponema sp.]|jgi:4-methyl-5(b-hydroxyethyl)-thiazole monophosphate biosynthesis|nr:DJ-1/PfpI family protein [Treponema sp.]
MPKRAIVLLADGFEEVEAATPITYLRRAGIEVTTAAVTEKAQQSQNLTVNGARGIQMNADTVLSKLSNSYDAVIVPGGMPGAANLAASKEVSSLLKEMAASCRLVCAICASPAVVLAPLGLLAGKKFTCFTGMEEKAKESAASCGCVWSEDRVVTDGNIITSRSAGTAGEFSIAIISSLLGEEDAKKVAETVLLNI